MDEEWWELCDTMLQTAEGFAATDRANAGVYRQQAADFAALDRPADAAELELREALAHTIRLGWSDLFRRRHRP